MEKRLVVRMMGGSETLDDETYSVLVHRRDEPCRVRPDTRKAIEVDEASAVDLRPEQIHEREDGFVPAICLGLGELLRCDVVGKVRRHGT